MINSLSVSDYQRLAEALVTAVDVGEHAELDELGECIFDAMDDERGRQLLAALLGIEEAEVRSWMWGVLTDPEPEEYE